MSEQSHFEILSHNGRVWSVEAIVPSKDEAIERAKAIQQRKDGSVVKVIQATFGNAAGEFFEKEVLLLGNRPSTARSYGDDLDAGSPCHTMEDIFSPQSRQAIRRVMRQWLDANRLTPVELLHNPEYINRFEASGTMLQSAVQRAAMAQAAASKIDVKARQRELYDLADQVAAKARTAWRTERIPAIENDDFDGFVDSIAAEEDKEYLFNVAVTNWLRQFVSSSDKLVGLLEIASQSDKPATTAHLDGFLTDFFEDANAVAKLIGDQKSLGEAVLRLAALINPSAAATDPSVVEKSLAVSADDDDDADEDQEETAESIAVDQFRRLMQRGRFPKCRQSLVRRIEQTLTGNRSFTGEGNLAEAQLLSRLYHRLCDEDGEFILGPELEEAFVERSQSYVSGNAIGRILDGVVLPLKRITILLQVLEGVFGKSARRRIGEYVLAILREPENQDSMRKPDSAPAVHMRHLGRVQRLILASKLQKRQKSEASALLDDICVDVMAREQILAKIADRSSSNIDECMSILKLCAAGTFTEGRAAEIARNRAVAVMRAPGFAEAFLRRGNDKLEMQKMLTELETLMSKSGINNLSMMGAMVAAQA